MINSRKIEDLEPEVAEKANKLIRLCSENGIKIIITSTYRDNEMQDYLYSQGRTRPGNIVTNVKGNYSFHNHKVAFDFCPVNDNGKAEWNDIEKFKRVGELGKSLGLEWGGDWKNFKDYPHFQLTNGRSIEYFISKKPFTVGGDIINNDVIKVIPESKPIEVNTETKKPNLIGLIGDLFKKLFKR